MHRSKLRNLAWVCLGAWAFASPASAQAPIVYAGQGAETALEGGLAGGGGNSYGYGAQQADAAGAAIDLRRSADAATQGRPPWLEQERVGPPYEAKGRWYVPTVEPGYEQTGTASWYGAALSRPAHRKRGNVRPTCADRRASDAADPEPGAGHQPRERTRSDRARERSRPVRRPAPDRRVAPRGRSAGLRRARATPAFMCATLAPRRAASTPTARPRRRRRAFQRRPKRARLSASRRWRRGPPPCSRPPLPASADGRRPVLMRQSPVGAAMSCRSAPSPI